MITAAGRMLMKFGRGALRQTKRLSPYKSSLDKGVKSKFRKKKGTAFTGIKSRSAKTMKTQEELTTIGSGINKGMKKLGFSATKRRQALYGYNRGYKHLARNKKLYGAGVTGAAAWDFLPGKDNE